VSLSGDSTVIASVATSLHAIAHFSAGTHDLIISDGAARLATLNQGTAAMATAIQLAGNSLISVAQFEAVRDLPNFSLNGRMLIVSDTATNLLTLDGDTSLIGITLLQGTKAYGVHTGRAMRVPAREHDALRDHVNFYFDQQDLVAERAARAGFAWTIFRPQIVLGLAVGSAMNPVAALGAYAVLCRERGLPLTYPGHPHLLTECTDARLIAEAIEWAWDAPRAHGEAFNISNGDVILWPTLFPRMAAHFGLALGEPAPQRLRDTMPPGHVWWTDVSNMRPPDFDGNVYSRLFAEERTS
jgi:hypothetical protein